MQVNTALKHHLPLDVIMFLNGTLHNVRKKCAFADVVLSMFSVVNVSA